MRALIERGYGKEANDYIKNLLNDLNGGVIRPRGRLVQLVPVANEKERGIRVAFGVYTAGILFAAGVCCNRTAILCKQR